MLIGIYSPIPYLTFLGALFPVAIAGLAISAVVIWLLYRKELRPDAFSTRPVMPAYEVSKPLLARALVVCAAILVAFSLGYPYSLTVMAGAGALLLIGSVANLIMAQQARKRVALGSMEYFRAGVLITVLTSAVGILVLAVEVNMAQGAEIPVAHAQEKPMTVTVVPSNPAAAQRTFRVVLLCETTQSRTRGLQGFRKLQANEAALFIFDKPEKVTFWMGSVSFAIDIIFVGPDEKVVRTTADCKPGSRDLYLSGQAVKWVVETAAGSGIRAGDRVRIE